MQLPGPIRPGADLPPPTPYVPLSSLCGPTCPTCGGGVHRSRAVGAEAITEWLFTGTRCDGSRVETEGLDLFGFEGALVVYKSAFRKDRPALKPSPATA